MRPLVIRLLSGFLLAAVLAAPAVAQDKDMIVVTGQRIAQIPEEAMQQVEVQGGRAAFSSGPPYVSITVPADYVIFTVSLETGTRAVDERKRELERAFTTLAARVSRDKSVTMEVGDPGESAALETTAAREAIVDDGDRSHIPIVMKFLLS